MSAVKSGVSLRTLILTPERVPSFFIPSRSPFFTPKLRRSSTDRTRLLSDNDDQDSSGTSQPGSPTDPVSSPRFALRLPTPRTGRLRRATATEEDQDSDVTTRAAMSLSHVQKVTTPYGFRAVLAASPCTRRRESLFHRSEPVTVTVTDDEPPEPEKTLTPPPCDNGGSRVSCDNGGSRVSMRPVKSLGLQVMKELKKPAAALRALTPSRKASPRK